MSKKRREDKMLLKYFFTTDRDTTNRRYVEKGPRNNYMPKVLLYKQVVYVLLEHIP